MKRLKYLILNAHLRYLVLLHIIKLLSYLHSEESNILLKNHKKICRLC